MKYPGVHLVVKRTWPLIVAMALLSLSGAVAAATPPALHGKLSGTWEVKWCDPDRKAECGGFMLHLVQKGSRLCGSHDAATVGLSRLDDGADRSVVGVVDGRLAVATAQSGRSEAVVMVTLREHLRTLEWTVVERVSESTNGDHDLFPPNAVLRKVKAGNATERFKAVRAACDSYWKSTR